MVQVALRSVSVMRDEATLALDDVDLDIADGSTVCVLGRSGSGKSTILRVIAGLTPVTEGRVLFDGEDITGLQTKDRRVGIVGRQNVLPSHQSARRTIGFPLRFRRPEQNVHEVDRQIEAEAARHGVEKLLDSRPDQLSGGERLLVQSARALIDSPTVLLVDEPFADLDSARRQLLRRRLRERWADTSVVLATSDPQDGVMVADHLVVMADGRVRQEGIPAEVRARPLDLDVASLMGEPEFVVVPATVRATGDDVVIDAGTGSAPAWAEPVRSRVGLPVSVGVWPEDVHPEPRPGDLLVEGEVDLTEPLGAVTVTHLRLANRAVIRVPLPGPARPRGAGIRLGLDGRRLHVFDALDGRAIHHPLA